MGVGLVEKITSTTNEKIKEVAKLQQKKYREETGLFIAEGEKAIEGILKAGFNVTTLFIKEENQYSKFNAPKIFQVNDAVMSKISATKTPCTCLAVVQQKKYNPKEFPNKKRLLLLENIKDAGNLGTILRACKAFDFEGILLLGETIDLYNPKVVRASVGCFDMPVVNIKYEDLKLFENHNIYSTALYENSKPLKTVKFDEPLIIAFGSEAEGLSQEFLKNKTININIEMNKNVESLNLASAVSICLYETYLKK